MKIKGICNKSAGLPSYLIGKGKMCKGNEVFALTIDREYLVYGMTVIDGIVWYYVCEDDFVYYPSLVPSPFFKVLDNRLSRHWKFFIHTQIRNEQFYYFNDWVFQEWGDNIEFHHLLIERDKQALEIFNTYKIKMDLEFPHPIISETAGIADRDWLMCPKCIDAWQWPSDLDAQVICPSCGTVYKNPRYNGI